LLVISIEIDVSTWAWSYS